MTAPVQSRRRRLLLWTGGAVAGLMLLTLATVRFMPGLWSDVVARAIGDAIGAQVQVEGMHWRGGDLVLQGVQVRAKTLDGPAADILQVDALQVTFTGMLPTDPSAIVAINIDRARLCVAGDRTSTAPRLNIDALGRAAGSPGTGSPTSAEPKGSGEPDDGGPAESPMQPPAVTIDELELVVGQFAGADFTLTGEARFSVSLVPQPDGTLEGDLVELSGPDGEEGLVLRASGNPRAGTGSISMQHLLLDARTEGLIPWPTVRSAVDALHLSGDIPSFTMAFTESMPVQASMALDDLTLRLDGRQLGVDDQSRFWATMRDGRMHEGGEPPVLHVDGGRLEFQGDRLRIAGLRGRLASARTTDVDVPWQVDLTIDDLMETAQDATSLEAVLERAPFHLRLSADDVHMARGQEAVLPRQVARIMQMFGVQAGRANVHVDALRTSIGEDVSVSGLLHIHDGQGAYEHFDYPLESLDATIEYDLETVTVQHLRAFGRAGATIEIAGSVEARHTSDIDLGLVARYVPLDDTLLQAMPRDVKRAMRDVFPDQADIDAGSAPGAQDRFDRVSFDLRVDRANHGPIHLNGDIDFDALTLEWKALPWPIVVQGGRLQLHEGHIELLQQGAPGATFTTPDGVEGRLSLDIDAPSLDARGEDARFAAQISLQMNRQPLTAALVEAVHVLTAEGGRVLDETRLQGLVDADVQVGLRSQAAPDYTVALHLNEGSVVLTHFTVDEDVRLDALLGADAAAVHGGIRVTPGEVSFVDLSLDHEDTRLLLDGPRPQDGPMRLRGSRLHLGDWVVALLSDAASLPGSELVHRWQPRGRFDVEGTVEGRALRALVRGVEVELHGMQPPIRAVQDGGGLLLFPGGVAFESMNLNMHVQGRSLGSVAFTGDIGAAAGGMQVDGRGVDLGNPVVTDLVEALGSPVLGDLVRRHDPCGEIDFTASLAPDDWSIQVQPWRLAVTRDGHRLAADVQRGSVYIDAAGMQVQDLQVTTHGQGGGGFDGTLQFRRGAIDGRFQIDGPLDGALMDVIGGRALQDALGAVGFRSGAGDRLRNGRVVLQGIPDAVEGVISGDITLEDASIEPGVDVQALSGSVEGRLDFEPGGRPQVRLDLRGLAGRVGPMPLDQLHGSVHVDRDSRVTLDALAGGVADGRVVIEGSADAQANTWHVNVLVAGARLEAMQRAQSEDPATGRVEMALRLGGAFKGGARRGTGQFRVVEADLGPLPVAVALQQLLQFSSPLVGTLNYAELDFHVNDDNVVLEDVLLEASSGDVASFSLHGEGTMAWPSFEVDLHLRPRGSWLLLSDLIGLVQDQLYEIRVQGSLLDPDVELVGLPGLAGSP